MLEVKIGDITKAECDVIINAANTELKHLGGVAKAIAEAGGKVIEEESKLIGFVPIGDFAITSAGKLKAKKIIHIPTIDYKNGGRKIIYDELLNVLNKVFDYCFNEGYHLIALPLLGTGVVGLDEKNVLNIITDLSFSFPDLKIYVYKLK